MRRLTLRDVSSTQGPRRNPVHHRRSYLLQFLASLSSLVFQYGQQQRLTLHRAQRFQDFVHPAKKNKKVLIIKMIITTPQVATKETEAVQVMTAILAAAAAPAAVANWGYSATSALASIACRTWDATGSTACHAKALCAIFAQAQTALAAKGQNALLARARTASLARGVSAVALLARIFSVNQAHSQTIRMKKKMTITMKTENASGTAAEIQMTAAVMEAVAALAALAERFQEAATPRFQQVAPERSPA